jgi:hypothetical protein
MGGFRDLPGFCLGRGKIPSLLTGDRRPLLADEAQGDPEGRPSPSPPSCCRGWRLCRSMMSADPAFPFRRTIVLRIMGGTGGRSPPAKCFPGRGDSERVRERLFFWKELSADPLQGEGEFAIIDRWESFGRGFGAEPRGCLRFLLPDARKEGPVCHDGIQAHYPAPPLCLQRRQ